MRRDDPLTQTTVPENKELPAGTLRAILRAVGISVDDFSELL